MFLGRLGREDGSENFCKFTKVSYFWDGFSLLLSRAKNKYKTTASVHCWFCTKKLVNIKAGTLSFLSLKCPFWGQNGLNICNQLQMPEYMVSVYSTWDIYLCLDQTKNKVQIFSIASVQ